MVGELVTPMIKRAFSRDERNFYNTLANGIDENILYVLSWLKTHEASELLDADDEDEFDDIFAASGLHDELNKRIQRNTLNGIAPLSRFYKVGSRLAYNQYHQTQRYTPQDAEALEILNRYVGDTVYNVNVDSCLGIKDILMMGALTGIGISKLGEKLLQSPYTITPHSAGKIQYLGYLGRVQYEYLYYDSGVRPSISLLSDIMISGGDGTSTNPYIVG